MTWRFLRNAAVPRPPTGRSSPPVAPFLPLPRAPSRSAICDVNQEPRLFPRSQTLHPQNKSTSITCELVRSTNLAPDCGPLGVGPSNLCFNKPHPKDSEAQWSHFFTSKGTQEVADPQRGPSLSLCLSCCSSSGSCTHPPDVALWKPGKQDGQNRTYRGWAMAGHSPLKGWRPGPGDPHTPGNLGSFIPLRTGTPTPREEEDTKPVPGGSPSEASLHPLQQMPGFRVTQLVLGDLYPELGQAQPRLGLLLGPY